jgi:cephalosporin hydroxylase
MQSSSNRLAVPLLTACVLVLAGVVVWQRVRPPVSAAQPARPAAPAQPAAVPCELSEMSERELIDRMIIRYTEGNDTWKKNKWLGIPALQNPMDVWITQEILSEVKPDFVIDSGTFAGGSAALWATILEQLNPEARVITIDVNDNAAPHKDTPILRKRVDFLIGSSTAPEIVADVKKRVAGRSTVVILDSLHTKEHVLDELRAYAPLVPVGSYMIVQDGVFNGHPVPGGWGPGPYEAVEAFLAENDQFIVDTSRERLMITSNPKGFLKRIKPAPAASAG